MMVTAGTDGDGDSDDDILKLKAGDHDSLFSLFIFYFVSKQFH